MRNGFTVFIGKMHFDISRTTDTRDGFELEFSGCEEKSLPAQIPL